MIGLSIALVLVAAAALIAIAMSWHAIYLAKMASERAPADDERALRIARLRGIYLASQEVERTIERERLHGSQLIAAHERGRAIQAREELRAMGIEL